MSAQSGRSFDEARADREFWARPAETAVQAHLANAAAIVGFELYYWRERNREVDFVVSMGRRRVAIEAKSGRPRDVLPGFADFAARFEPQRELLVGTDGIAIEAFLSRDAEHLITP